jgi:hypothetical protein
MRGRQDLQFVARKAYHPLHRGVPRARRGDHLDDIAPLRCAEYVGEGVDQCPIAGMQAREHARPYHAIGEEKHGHQREQR